MSQINKNESGLSGEEKSRILSILKEKYPQFENSFERKLWHFLNGNGPSPKTQEGKNWVKYVRSLEAYTERFPRNRFTGYELCGLDARGFNKAGIHFETQGIYDPDGFNKDGYDEEGFNFEGYDDYGYCREGFSKYDGFNREGCNKEGYDRRGKDREGYNKNGFKEGYNRNGYDKYGFDKNGYDANGNKGKTLEDRKKEGILKYYEAKANEPEVEEPQPYGGIYSTTDGQ